MHPELVACTAEMKLRSMRPIPERPVLLAQIVLCSVHAVAAEVAARAGAYTIVGSLL